MTWTAQDSILIPESSQARYEDTALRVARVASPVPTRNELRFAPVFGAQRLGWPLIVQEPHSPAGHPPNPWFGERKAQNNNALSAISKRWRQRKGCDHPSAEKDIANEHAVPEGCKGFVTSTSARLGTGLEY